MGWGNKDIKEYISAGLPNITGQIGEILHAELSNGAFKKKNVGYRIFPDGEFLTGIISFDASRSNNIYGASDTVQPPAYTVYYIMKIR